MAKKLTKKQKEIAEINKTIMPLSQTKENWCIKHSARYIYIDKQNNGWCTRCETKVMMPKTKHLTEITCPNCRHKMKALHTWRRSDKNGYWGLEDAPIDWFVFTQAIDENLVLLRYLSVCREGTEPKTRECARMYIDFKENNIYRMELPWGYGAKKEWAFRTYDFFRESGMGYYWRRWCCMGADPYPYTLKQLKKINVFKHMTFTQEVFRHFYVSSVLIHSYKRKELYEKLLKAGFVKLVIDDLHSYSRIYDIQYDKSQTSLVKMLGLNKGTLNLLKSCQTRDALNWLKKHPNANEKTFAEAKMMNFSTKFDDLIAEYHIKRGKTWKYIQQNAKTASDRYSFIINYCDFVQALKDYGYPLDNSNLYPKNFNEKNNEVHKLLHAREVHLQTMKRLGEVREQAKIDSTINEISKALYQNKGIMEWLKGSQGLKVVVPSSASEIVDEGIALHNCLQKSVYIKKMADKESLIFFIRKIDEPDKAYIAMEYTNGKVEQLYLDYNDKVTDEKIIQFADLLAARLNQLDILNQLKKVA